jgi:hypothetical protein
MDRRFMAGIECQTEMIKIEKKREAQVGVRG